LRKIGVWQALDDRRIVHLKPHDILIQNGTRHAWRHEATGRRRSLSR
jgi:hypothetical protein